MSYDDQNPSPASLSGMVRVTGLLSLYGGIYTLVELLLMRQLHQVDAPSFLIGTRWVFGLVLVWLFLGMFCVLRPHGRMGGLAFMLAAQGMLFWGITLLVEG